MRRVHVVQLCRAAGIIDGDVVIDTLTLLLAGRDSVTDAGVYAASPVVSSPGSKAGSTAVSPTKHQPSRRRLSVRSRPWPVSGCDACRSNSVPAFFLVYCAQAANVDALFLQAWGSVFAFPTDPLHVESLFAADPHLQLSGFEVAGLFRNLHVTCSLLPAGLFVYCFPAHAKPA